jgi:drug/metabolite transporter (DMT)-like permease
LSEPGSLAGEMAGLAAAATWAVGSTLFSRIGRSTSPLAMNLAKCLSAGALLALTFLALHGVPARVPTSALAWLGASALAGLSVGDTAYFGALVRLGVPRAILLLSTAPVFATLLAWLYFAEPITPRSGAGIAVTLFGIALTVTSSRAAPGGEATASSGRARIAAGVALGLVAGLGQATGSLLSKRAMREGLDPLFVSAARLLVGGLALVATAAVRGRLRAVGGELGRDRTLLRVAGASFLGSYAGIWLSQVAIQETPSTGVATTLLATSPVFALPIAHWLGDERIRPRGVLGVVLTVVGVALLGG